ncbi:hypothetical protein BV898_11003 [Hypsibius exemplaris]|uniref:Elongator complex protein 5 n=1 Tax=Hypsibius exemplaris TaxID=2072580 RepID=A0A1W0WI37_HYPEX|nr:hypothetical protein BV898_11003 [Hypsibius exemplaris]
MANNSTAKQIFETSKTPDTVLFLDKRPHSALDLLTLFILRRYASDPTRTAVHILSNEGRTPFWKERLRQRLPDRVFVYDVATESYATEALLEQVRKMGSSTTDFRHVVICDSTGVFVERSADSFCTFLARLPGQIADASGGTAPTSIGLLHHSDVNDIRAERALKFVCTSSVTVVESSQNKVGQQDFICSVEHLRHEEGHTSQMERITVNDDWNAVYSPAESIKQSRPYISSTDSSSDPASNLSFNLRLTSEERTARDQVALPHVRGGSVIYYEPDEADDIDYEEPEE